MATLLEQIATIKTLIEKLEEIAFGDEEAVVSYDGNHRPSISKRLSDEINSMRETTGIVAENLAASQTAMESAQAALASALVVVSVEYIVSDIGSLPDATPLTDGVKAIVSGGSDSDGVYSVESNQWVFVIDLPYAKKAYRSELFSLISKSQSNPGVISTIEIDGKVVAYVNHDGNLVATVGFLGAIPDLYQDDSVDKSIENPGVLSTYQCADKVVSVVSHLGELIDLKKNTEFHQTKPADLYSTNEFSDAMWSYWVWPKAIRFNYRDYCVSIGSSPRDEDQNGSISIAQSYKNSCFKKVDVGLSIYGKYGIGRTDDHNAPCLLIDPRQEAKKPLMLFQNDHTMGATRKWESDSYDIQRFGDESTVTWYQSWTYAQAMRDPENPDRIFLFARNSGSDAGVWWLLCSSDNGESWKYTKFSDKPFLYFMAKPSTDGLGINVVSYLHPGAAPNQKISYCKFLWDGSVVDSAGNEIVSNVLSGGSSIFDPIDDGSLIYDAVKTIRLMDFQEVSENNIHIAFAEFDLTPAVSGHTYYGIYDVSAGSFTSSQVAECGITIGGTSSYIAGSVICGENEMASSTWDGLTGKLSIYKTSDFSTWNETIIEQSNEKIIRPLVIEELHKDFSYSMTRRLVYLKGDPEYSGGYSDFDVFSCTAKFIDLE